MSKLRILILILVLLALGAIIYFWKFSPKSSADTGTYCPLNYRQLDCPLFTWDDNIVNNNPACDTRIVGDSTVYWQLGINPATNKVYASGKVSGNGPIDLGARKLIDNLSVAIVRPIFVPAGTSINLQICAGATTTETLAKTNCASFIPSVDQNLVPDLLPPGPGIYYSMVPASNSVAGRFVTLKFTLSSSNPDFTPRIGPNRMWLNYSDGESTEDD